jgi:hypothetical protein
LIVWQNWKSRFSGLAIEDTIWPGEGKGEIGENPGVFYPTNRYGTFPSPGSKPNHDSLALDDLATLYYSIVSMTSGAAGSERTFPMRYVHSLFLLSFFALSAFALEPRFGAGFDIGFQNSWLDSGVLEAPRIGVNLPVSLAEGHGVQVSIRYSPKGFENTAGINYESNWLHYIEIPVCYTYYPDFFPLELGLNAGFYYSYLLGVSDKNQNGFQKALWDTAYSKTDYGFTIGVHYRKPVPHGKLVFSIEYSGGLSTVRDFWQDNYENTEIRPVKNHALCFSLGFDLPQFGTGSLSGGSSGSKK